MGARGASTKRTTIAALAEQMERDLSGIRRALRRPLDAEVAKGELTAPQTSVMQVVVRQDGISLKDLSKEVSLAHSTVSGIVDRLEKRGLLSRRPDPQDGRISRVYPTAVVREFVRNQIPMLTRGPLEAALERLKPAERVALGDAVKRLRELLEKA
ncbi:MAG: MarR family transcriptional regulator [Terracidiphilus sp.]